MNPLGLIAAIFSAGIFFWAAHALRVRPLRERLLVFVLFTVASLPALLVAIYYLHVLPERAWFYTFRSWPGSEFLIVLLAVALGVVATFLPRILIAFPFVLLMAVALLPYAKPILSPLPENALREQWRGDACLQSTPGTCGPASVATILKALGTTTSEHALARASYGYSGGTEAWYLARAVRRLGYEPQFDFRDTYAPEVPLPALVGVRLGGSGHFIAVLSIKGEDVTYSDSLEGERQLPLAQFQRRYQFTGFHMSIRKR